MPFGVECSPPRTHGWGSEEPAGPPKGRRPGGGDAAAVPGGPERAPLQRGHRERAALPGLPQHPVWLLGSAAQPRGEPMVSGVRMGRSRHPRAGREGCLRDSLPSSNFPLSEGGRRETLRRPARWRSICSGKLTYLEMPAPGVRSDAGPWSWELGVAGWVCGVAGGGGEVGPLPAVRYVC